MENIFQSKSVPRGTRTIWRYLSALILLFSLSIGQMWAATEDNPTNASNNTEVSGTSYSIDGTLVAGAADKSTGMDRKGVKIRTNKTIDEKSNVIKFTVKSGYKITAIELKGTANSSTAFTIGSYSIDDGDAVTKSVEFPVKTGTAVSYSISGFNATSAVYFYVSDGAGQQFRMQYAVTYEETGGGGDTEAPTLVSSNPNDQDDDVAVEGTIVLTFSEAIASVDGSKFTLTGATKGTVAIDGTDSKKVNIPYSGAANEATVTLSVAAEAVADAAGNKSDALDDLSFTTEAAETPVCPAGLSIDGTHAYTEGQTISLTANLGSGNGDITYTWYKGADSDFDTAKAAGSIGTGKTFTKASCATGDAGYYWCEASKEGCAQQVHNGSEFVVSVEAKTCPTSGVLFSLEFVNSAKVTMSDGDNLALTSTYATITGGSASIKYFKSGNTNKEVLTTGHLISYGTNDQYLKLNLDCPLAPGDKIELADGSGVEIALATDDATPKDATHKVITSSYTYTVVADDALDGQTVLYLGRSDATSSKHGVVTITRPYDVSFVSDHGAAPTTPTKAVSFTLTELSDASFTHTGWTADKAVKVGGETKAASTALAVDATVELTDNTTFTATWEAKVTKYTVSYYDGAEDPANKLGDELVVEGSNPTAAEIVVPHKLGYTFAGWSTTNGGAVVPLNTISVAADMPLFAVFNAVNCSAQSGTIFSLILNNAPAANCTIKNASGFDQEADLIKYGTVSGGIALAKNSSTSNHIVITTDPKLRLLGGNGKVHIQLDCALQEGDKIRTTIENQNIAYTTTDVRSTTNYFTKGTDQELTITSGHALENATEIYLWSASSSDGKLISLEVIRPEKFEVTFNMHDHGDAVAKQYILDGGKVTKPTDPTASGWDFGGWFTDDTYGTTWDFENMTISAATEIHALWTEHVASSDATLSSLTVNGEAITLEDGVFGYAFELPMGTTALPTIVAVANDPNSKGVSVLQTNIGSATITVTAEDDSFKAYTITFTVATSKDIELVWDKSVVRCDATTPSAVVKSDNASVSAYINKITATAGGEGSSLNVGKNPGDMFTLSAKPGYAFEAMSFFGKIEDASCEYSLDGGAWQTLASTNTSGNACYADVFSAAEVHELRMKIIGSNGFWIRNMQLTMIEACTPVALAWDEEPVEFEVGKAGYAIAATANNSGTITYGSTDASIVAVDAGNGVLSVAALGSVTLSASTAEGDGTTYCDNSGTDIVISKVVNTYFLVTLDAQNGDAPAEIKFHNGDAAIAEPAEPIYAGHTFQGWLDESDDPVVWPLTPTVSMALHASWTADCTAPTIDVQPASANYLTGRAAVALNCEATAAGSGALSYVWYSCDNASRENPVALSGAPTPSTAVAGTFYFYCDVTEEGCANVAHSDVAVITVADKDPICLIWGDVADNSLTRNAEKSKFNGTLVNQDVRNNAVTLDELVGPKFQKPSYLSIALEGQDIKAGDQVAVFVTASNVEDKLRIFNANEAKDANIVAQTSGNMTTRVNKVTMLEDASTIYLRRGDDYSSWNPCVAYVAVYRACAPILNSVTFAGVEAAPDNTNHVAIEVPASTADAAFEAIAYDWVSNNDAWTAAHNPVAANAWEWGVENIVTFADKDGDESVYYITISKAAASSDATLSSLSYGTPATAIALADGVYEYNVELPYGTSSVPALAATKNHVGATIVSISDAAAFVDRKATSTVTVKAEDDATTQVYTVNFTVSRYESKLIWDGATMTSFDDAVAAATAAGVSVVKVGDDITVESKNASFDGKNYTKCIQYAGATSASRNFGISVPAGKVAKMSIVYRPRSAGERSIIIGTDVAGAINESAIVYATTTHDHLDRLTADIFAGGTIYINTTNGYQVFEISIQLADGFARSAMLGNGVLGTVCVDHNVAVEDIQGVTVYELVGREPQYGKVAFDEIISGELEAGAPYVFQAHRNHMALLYGETSVAEPVDKGNGMYGTFSAITLTELDDVYYFAQRALWSCVDLSSLSVPANRAYVKLSEIDYISDPNPAPGRRRVMMSVNGKNTPTALDEIRQEQSANSQKLLINGQLFILRGEKIYDATGRLVK